MVVASVQELQNEKVDLGVKIGEAIQKFELRWGVQISNIAIERLDVTRHDSPRRETLVHVSLGVEL
jgi:hypothetical protein